MKTNVAAAAVIAKPCLNSTGNNTTCIQLQVSSLSDNKNKMCLQRKSNSDNSDNSDAKDNLDAKASELNDTAIEVSIISRSSAAGNNKKTQVSTHSSDVNVIHSLNKLNPAGKIENKPTIDFPTKVSPSERIPLEHGLNGDYALQKKRSFLCMRQIFSLEKLTHQPQKLSIKILIAQNKRRLNGLECMIL